MKYGLFSIAVRASDKRMACDEEFSDSEDEGEGGRRDRANFKQVRKRMRPEEGDKKEEKDTDDKTDVKTEVEGKTESTKWVFVMDVWNFHVQGRYSRHGYKSCKLGWLQTSLLYHWKPMLGKVITILWLLNLPLQSCFQKFF